MSKPKPIFVLGWLAVGTALAWLALPDVVHGVAHFLLDVVMGLLVAYGLLLIAFIPPFLLVSFFVKRWRRRGATAPTPVDEATESPSRSPASSPEEPSW
jgi:hypothetical protein